jgi:8-oxo-dGTP pyrophosphatase MutT (NUDIX family)
MTKNKALRSKITSDIQSHKASNGFKSIRQHGLLGIDPSEFKTFNEFISAYADSFTGNINLYTCMFAHGSLFKDSPRYCLVVKKEKGTRHAGHLNLPGGHIEKGEKPHEAAIRELKEETGLDSSQPQLVGAIINGPMDSSSPFLVYVYRTIIWPQQTITSEPNRPATWELIDRLSTRKFIPNLRYIIPFLAADLIGFVCQDSHWPANWQLNADNPIGQDDLIASQAIITFLPHKTSDAIPSQRKRRIEAS